MDGKSLDKIVRLFNHNNGYKQNAELRERSRAAAQAVEDSTEIPGVVGALFTASGLHPSILVRMALSAGIMLGMLYVENQKEEKKLTKQ